MKHFIKYPTVVAATKVSKAITANAISNQLPPSINEFLMDIAQMFGGFTYTDVINHEFTKADIHKLKYLRSKILDLMEEYPEDDPEVDKYVERVADIIDPWSTKVTCADNINDESEVRSLRNEIDSLIYQMYQEYEDFDDMWLQDVVDCVQGHLGLIQQLNPEVVYDDDVSRDNIVKYVKELWEQY